MGLILIQLFCTQAYQQASSWEHRPGPFISTHLRAEQGKYFCCTGFFSSAHVLFQSSGIWVTVNNCLANCKVINIVRQIKDANGLPKAYLLRINISTTTAWPLMPQSCLLQGEYLFKIISCPGGLTSTYPAGSGPLPEAIPKVSWYQSVGLFSGSH